MLRTTLAGAGLRKNRRGIAMKSNAFNFRAHFDRQLFNLAELKKRQSASGNNQR